MYVKPVRYQQQGCLLFISSSCYRCMPLFDGGSARDTVELALERVRCWYGCCIAGYPVTPEHVHLLTREPERSLGIAQTKTIAVEGRARRLQPSFRGRGARATLQRTSIGQRRVRPVIYHRRHGAKIIRLRFQ